MTTQVYKGAREGIGQMRADSIDHVEPMQVQNPTIALELLAKDAGAMQQYRELTQNAIQAILAKGEPGEILWDVDWRHLEWSIEQGLEPIYRLSCIDTGEGMSGEDQIRYINHLFVSGREQGTDKNFGIGAKVTAGAKNPAGLMYQSWRDDKSSMIIFQREGGSNTPYGLKRFDIDGRFHSWVPIADSQRPPLIRQSGTAVTLMGLTGNEHTVLAPEGAGATGMKWLAKYLNQRYFEFPDSITIRARELPAERSNWPRARPAREEGSGTSRREITGMKRWLDRNTSDRPFDGGSGRVTLQDGAVAHWWILREGANSDVHVSRGHTAALFQAELYDMADANGHRVRLQPFGILYSSKRVAIYIEPRGDVTATVARDSLRIAGEPLPWDAWGASFKSQLPAAIVDLENEIRDSASKADHNRAIKDRLKQFKDLFKITAWKVHENGSERAWGSSPSGGQDRTGTGTGRKGRSGQDPGGRGTSRTDYLSIIDPDGVAASEVNPKRDLPKVHWVAFSKTDGPADRAAEYVREENEIFANTEFRVFSDMIDRFVDEVGASDDAQVELVQDTVREWYEQVLTEAVIRSWNFEHEQMWQDSEYRQLVSPESLTMAVLPFTFLLGRIRQGIGVKIGRSA